MDAEMLVANYLNAQNLGATAYYDNPSELPSTFIVVERTGGGFEQRVTGRPMLDVQCWAESRPQAAALADSVRAVVVAMPDELPNVFGVSVTSTFRDTDLEAMRPRYHVVFELYTNE